MLGNNIDRDVIYTRYYVRCVIFIIFFSVSPCVSCSVIPLFATPWTIAHQGPLSMKFFGLEYWSGLPFPSPEDLPDPGMKPRSPALQADALPSEPPGKLSHYSPLHFGVLCDHRASNLCAGLDGL